MLRGLRVSDSAILQRICGADAKLFLRVGTLLQAKLAFTELALEGAAATEAGRKMLADRRLRDLVPDQFEALASEHGCADLDLVMVDERGGAESGWRLIALADELGNPLTVAPALEAVLVPPTEFAAVVANLSPALRGPVEILMQARADDQRAAALEQLRYAMPPLPVISELMPMILSDGAELVRERAIGLLVATGANVAVVDLIRALQRRDDAALARHGESIARLPGMQQDLVVAAVLASLSRSNASQGVVNLCQQLSTHLATHRGLDRLIEQLLPTRLSMLDLVRSLQAVDRERIDAILLRQLGGSDERDAHLVVLLSAPGTGAETVPERARLIERGIELLLTPAESPPERMALASALRRLDHDRTLASSIAARGMSIGKAYETSVYWLLGELCRDGAVDAATAEVLAGLMRKLLRDASGPHLVSMLDQQLPALVPASDAARAALVEPMVETVARFVDDRSRDLVASSLMGIGSPAIAPLWIVLEEHPHEHVRMLSAELLPLLLKDAPAETLAAAVKRCMTGLGRASQARERASLVTAAAMLATAPGLAGNDAPARSVDDMVAGLGAWGIDALGHLAGGAHLGDERRARIVEDLLEQLMENLPDAPVESVTDSASNEVTFVLDERLGAHTENVPKMLAALARIGGSTSLPPALQRRIVDRLCLQWKRVANWETIWGPGNIQDLGRTLGQLAENPLFPGPLRLQVGEALMPRLSQLTIARSLARVFTSADGTYLSELAGRAAAQIIQHASDKYYADDEWEDLAEVLVDFLAVPHLGADGAVVRRRLVNVLGSYRPHVSSRARAKLRYITAELDEDLRVKLDWA
ncbi:MAG: hypothetical protein H0V44_12785 [Planctomycetes bacterium]|nr:hypothetical protein [Planctomycetota bacterium]